jgi:hypothetical protein
MAEATKELCARSLARMDTEDWVDRCEPYLDGPSVRALFEATQRENERLIAAKDYDAANSLRGDWLSHISSYIDVQRELQALQDERDFGV